MSERLSDNRDEELDRILREVSDSAEIPFSEEDWGDMESRLDWDSKPAGLGWFGMGLAWLGSMGIACSVALLIWNSPEERKGTSEIASKETSKSKVELSKDSILSTSGPIKAAIHSTLNFNPDLDPSSSQISNLNPELQAEQVLVGVSEIPGKQEVNDSSGETVGWGEQVKSKLGATDSREVAQRDSGEKSKSQQESLALPLEVDEEKLDEPNWQAELKANAVSEDLELKKDQDKKERFGGKFNLSFQVAPDLSGVQMDQLERAGNMIGLGAEYFIRPRLSVSSGLFYSYKPYSAEEGYVMGYGHQPNAVFGECDILDIPFNLRIYPLEGRVQRAFVSLGLSSYLMLSEHYELYFQGDDPDDSYSREVEVKGKNNHFFGVANFSVGYERKLGRTLSVQVEPYFKIPLKGVGEGDISLKSTGLFVGLKFYPSGINIR